MSEQIKDGGTAFPCLDAGGTGILQLREPGMTLRDYFAAKAMQACATNEVGAHGFTFDERAAWAYQQADAMLRAREVQS
ncbi:hypothetical protein ACDA63_07370 [Uliginosibacterium sp. sgz301328]|uniref:hypothetical protein n=1 Tax=Uliginosibacterium sp. sgz301328 TaxID=3243764 RepID=UPI00359CBE99